MSESLESIGSSFFEKRGRFLFGFGDKETTFETLSRRFPDLAWAQLKQTHSDKVVESDKPSSSQESLIEADAHYSTLANLGLLVKTADCLPVLISCESTDRPQVISAIHAGWRGVAAAIISKTVQTLLEQGYAPTKMKVLIGPHIQQQSFDVGLDVAEELFLAAKNSGLQNPKAVIATHPTDSSKRRVNLAAIARQQLLRFQIPENAIETLAIDTVTSPGWSSYRRDGANAGRNLSFIAKLE